jgi:hypothetical protein
MILLIRVSLICAVLSSAGSAGILTFATRDAWEMVASRVVNEDFSRPSGDSPNVGFTWLALTSDGRSTASSSDRPKVIHVDTSFVDLFASPDGGNYVGTVGRTTASTITTTTTNTEWCKNGTCVEGTPVDTTDSSDYSDVRTLEMNFNYAIFNFGFDYVSYLSGSSLNRMNHPYRMVLTFVDGTTSSLWVGGNHAFSDYQEGFMGVSSDIAIVSVLLRAADRSIASNYSTAGGDWEYQYSKPKKGDFYTYSFSETFSSDQSSALMIGNLSINTPEPATFLMLGAGLIVIGACGRRRQRSRTNR